MATETHTTAEHSAATASPGMPQLDFSNWGHQIVWLLLALVAIYLLLSRIALPRIASTLADRQEAISGDIAQAEALKAKAAEAETAYEKALSDARAEAQRIAVQTRARIQADLDQATREADTEIAAQVAESRQKIAEIQASALENLRLVALETTQDLVASLGGRADTAGLTAAVDTAIATSTRERG
ncbi:MAG: F0F1 ATP synthase subunit B' [Rhodobacteraceae bacterium]|nr:F0F1 ATP synthase subunit B' [Paracoccaceae bacterium]